MAGFFLFISILNFASVEDIIQAAKAGDAARIEALLAENPELVKAKGSGLGATALHWAAKSDSITGPGSGIFTSPVTMSDTLYVEGAVTFTGAFTSLGIDDNATLEVLASTT